MHGIADTRGPPPDAGMARPASAAGARVSLVQSLPFLVSLGVAVGVVPAAVQGLRSQGFVRQRTTAASRSRSRRASAMVAAVARGPHPARADRRARRRQTCFRPDSGLVLAYVTAVALLGLVDDLVGSAHDDLPRGWRGARPHHDARRLLHRRAQGGGARWASRCFVLSGRGASAGEYLLSVALLVLATNFFNLIDLRPRPLDQGADPARRRSDHRVDRRSPAVDGRPLRGAPVLVMLPLDLGRGGRCSGTPART